MRLCRLDVCESWKQAPPYAGGRNSTGGGGGGGAGSKKTAKVRALEEHVTMK